MKININIKANISNNLINFSNFTDEILNKTKFEVDEEIKGFTTKLTFDLQIELEEAI